MRAATSLVAVPALALAACGVNQTPQPEPPPELPACVPNRDGAITAAELPIAFDAPAAYYVGRDRPFRGAAVDGVWDLSEELPDDEVVALGPARLRDQWYAASFPTGQLALDGGDGLDGIYHQDERALWLDGIASREPMPAAGRTLIIYAAPIPVLRFPVVDGDAFTAVGVIPDGVVAGLPFIGTDEVSVAVDGEGRVDVPYVRFSPALRVTTHVVRAPSTGTPTIGRYTVSFLFECFGEVARAESRPNETTAAFTTAAYLRRFALGVTP